MLGNSVVLVASLTSILVAGLTSIAVSEHSSRWPADLIFFSLIWMTVALGIGILFLAEALFIRVINRIK